MTDKELQARNFLASLSNPNPTITEEPHLTNADDRQVILKNSNLIKEIDDLILSRFWKYPESISLKDLNSIKAEAFKQNRLLQGKDDWEWPNKIPSIVNIQIINNNA